MIRSIDLFSPLFKKLTPEFILEHEENFIRVYDYFDDDKSRETYIGYLKGAFTGDSSYYEPNMTPNEYFPEGIAPRRNDHIFLDVGAYNGDTIERFIKFTNGIYEKIYAFEPMENNVKIIQEKSFPKVEIYNIGVSDHIGEEIFYDDDDLNMALKIGSCTSKKTSFKISTIDEVLSGNPVTFVKMDIEGSELSALHGAEKTIKKYKPFLAICVYHKNDDFIKILPYIKSLVPEYKFYTRHHAINSEDISLYCSYN